MKGVSRPMIIAIDGLSGAGKGTLAKRLAYALSLAHLDTGLLYRAVAWSMMARGIDFTDREAAIKAAQDVDIYAFSETDLRSDAAAKGASLISHDPAVREALLRYQQAFAKGPYPPGKKGAVIDGRDIGTVICTDATLKLFLTASPQARAQRRFKELQARGIESIYEDVARDMELRDARDQTRGVSPCKPAQDAVILDTSAMTSDDVFAYVIGLLQGAGVSHSII